MVVRNEPLVTRASITALVSAVIGVLVVFGVPLNEEQQVAILALVGVLAPLVVAALARAKVTPTKTLPRRESEGS